MATNGLESENQTSEEHNKFVCFQRKRVREMSAEGVGKLVCVTGASGYVASWLVKLLLERGYTVRATIRNPSKSVHLT